MNAKGFFAQCALFRRREGVRGWLLQALAIPAIPGGGRIDGSSLMTIPGPLVADDACKNHPRTPSLCGSSGAPDSFRCAGWALDQRVDPLDTGKTAEIRIVRIDGVPVFHGQGGDMGVRGQIARRT